MGASFWWLLVAVAAVVIEAVSLSLITVWFVVGGLAAFVVAFLGGELWLQLVVFAAVTVACLVLLRPLALKYRKRGQDFESTPVGMTAVVLEPVDGSMKGRVETPDHMSWAAISATGELLEKGARVRVVGHESVKLIVERIEAC